MQDLAINVLLRPFAVLVLFLGAAVLAFGLKRVIPDGRVKEVLYRKRPLTDTLMVVLWLSFAVALIGVLLYTDPLRN